MQLESNDSSKEITNSANNLFDNREQGFKSVFENFFKQLAELNSLSTLGPFTSLINDPNISLNTLTEHGNLLIKYQSLLNLYLSQMTSAYFQALNKVSSALDEKKSDDVRRIIINTFEEVYSSMFESSEFSISYNNLTNSIIDLTKSYQKLFDTNSGLFRQQQQFSKEEKDLLFQSLYEIKKLSLEIKKKMSEKKNV